MDEHEPSEWQRRYDESVVAALVVVARRSVRRTQLLPD
jgi:hypothetical protein